MTMRKISLLTSLLLLLALAGCGFQEKVPAITTMDELPYPFETKKVALSNGMEVSVMDEGTGPKTLLMVHGLGSYGPAWKKNIEALQAQYRCVAVDLPGYGKSSKGNYEGSMRFFAEVIVELVEKMELENVTLIGHSMGGQISITATLAHPDLFRELILVAPAGFETFHPGQRQWFRDVLTPRAVALTPVDQIKANIGANFYKMPRGAEFMVTDRIAMRSCADFAGYCHIIPQCIQGMVDDPVFEFLPQIKARTLVIFGAQDNLIPNRFLNGGKTEKVAKQGAEQIPDCQLELVNKAGHFVHFEQSERVNQLMMDFLGGEE